MWEPFVAYVRLSNCPSHAHLYSSYLFYLVIDTNQNL